MSTRRCWWRPATTPIAPTRAIAAITASPRAARKPTTRCGSTRRRTTPWPRSRTTSRSIRTASIRSSCCKPPSVPPFVAEHRHLFGKALEAALAERGEARGVAAAELAHETRHDDAVGFGLAAQPCGELHRGAEQIVVVGHRLAGM